MATLTNIEQLKRDIENKQGEVATMQSNIETFEFSCTEEQFDDFLNDIQQSVIIHNVEFYPSDILKNCDPIAYRCAKSDYESNFDLNDVKEYQAFVASLDELETELEELETELEELESED